MAFSEEARRKAHGPAARRKAAATMRRNRRLKQKGSIPLAAISGRGPAKRKPKGPQFAVTVAGRIAAAQGLALRIVELLS